MAEPTPLLTPLKPAAVSARLWTHNQFVADFWRAVADDVAIIDGSRPLLSLARWRRERGELAHRHQRIGLVLEAGETLDPAIDDVSGLTVIALTFPKFTDGRAYSTARRLREQWHFQGEIRAVGDVLLDQIPLMLRAGFDAFEIVDAATAAALQRGHLPAVTRVYQSMGGLAPQSSAGRTSGVVPAWNARHVATSAATGNETAARREPIAAAE